MSDCIFCKIIKGDIPSFNVWEDEHFIAFLDIFPETKGMTIVIPKNHLPSYILEISDKQTYELMDAAKKVAKILDKKLEGIERVTFSIEGLDVNHLHIKLIPFYPGTKMSKPLMADMDELKDLWELITT